MPFYFSVHFSALFASLSGLLPPFEHTTSVLYRIVIDDDNVVSDVLRTEKCGLVV